METNHINTICVVGAGFMGTQIGLQCAIHGYRVWFIDQDTNALDRSSQNHRQELQKRVEKHEITSIEKEQILSRINFTTDLKAGTSQADLVIESVPERLEIKREVFKQLDRACPSNTMLATNSSSIRISAIEDATQRPGKVLNMHFYPLVWERPMVELMRGTKTSDETIESVRRLAYAIDMVPLIVRKESTGFVFNRVWRAIKKECLHLVDDGVASVEDTDRAWIIFTGLPMGPFGLMDMIGLDVIRDIEMVYYKESGDESDAPPGLLLNKIEKGELGVKTGKGFYTYPNPAYKDPSWLKGRSD